MDGQNIPVCTDENLQFYRSLNLQALSLDRVRRGRSALQTPNLKIRASWARRIGGVANGTEARKDRDRWNRIRNGGCRGRWGCTCGRRIGRGGGSALRRIIALVIGRARRRVFCNAGDGNEISVRLLIARCGRRS